MGSMPFHLEKGVIGLRLDYLIRDSGVRNHVLARLHNNENPLSVAQTIAVGSVIVNVINDQKSAFAAKLDALMPGTGAGAEYLKKQSLLRAYNQDSTGNRSAFIDYWKKAVVSDPKLIDVMRKELIIALASGREVDFWWECSLSTGQDPTVKTALELPEIARVLFRTDHGPVQAEKKGMKPRPPLDP